jgi:hypothetical protein
MFVSSAPSGPRSAGIRHFADEIAVQQKGKRSANNSGETSVSQWRSPLDGSFWRDPFDSNFFRNPIAIVGNLDKAFSKMFDDMGSIQSGSAAWFNPSVDVTESDKQYTVHAGKFRKKPIS